MARRWSSELITQPKGIEEHLQLGQTQLTCREPRAGLIAFCCQACFGYRAHGTHQILFGEGKQGISSESRLTRTLRCALC